MTREPRAFFALDRGAATTSASLVGFFGDRWRLIAHAAMPAAADDDALLEELADRVRRADPDMFAALAGDAAGWRDFPRLEARTAPPRRIAVLAGSRRQRRRLVEAASLAGWLVVAASSDEDDPLRLASLALAADTDAVLLGADATPAGDERGHLAQLSALVAAAAAQRPELDVVLAGGAATFASAFEGAGAGGRMSAEPVRDAGGPAAEETDVAEGTGESNEAEQGAEIEEGTEAEGRAEAVPAGGEGEPVEAPDLVPAGRAHEVVLAPDAAAGQPPGAALRAVLEGLRASWDDSRLAIARSIVSLAYVLDRSVELIEIGLDGALRCRADPVGEGHRSVSSSHAIVADAAFAPPDPPDYVVDAVLGWATIPLDRYRLADRLRELRLAPWAELDGDGALLRLAAARAGIERLLAATPALTERPSPDILVAAGGVWASLPPPVVALTMADLVRRPGATQLVLDHARLLAPFGTIEDEVERRQILGDLADDMLIPLGSLIMPAGLRLGRSAGRLHVRSGSGVAEVDLQPGGIEVVDLPPGQAATADLDFRDTVRLGGRGRHFTAQVMGGLGGLLVDLRDIPLRLPERPEARRAVLAAWQRALWGEPDL